MFTNRKMNLVYALVLEINCIVFFRNSVVSPVIDVIDWKTFQYYHSVGLHRGVFDWKLDFHWEAVPEHEEKVRQSPISPIR